MSQFWAAYRALTDRPPGALQSVSARALTDSRADREPSAMSDESEEEELPLRPRTRRVTAYEVSDDDESVHGPKLHLKSAAEKRRIMKAAANAATAGGAARRSSGSIRGSSSSAAAPSSAVPSPAVRHHSTPCYRLYP